MSVFEFFLSIFLAAFGLGLILYLISLILHPILPAIPNLRLPRIKRNKFKKYGKALDKIDALSAEGQYQSTLPYLKNAFILMAVHNPLEIGQARDHNQTVLSRCLVIADQLGAKLDNLAEVERLLIERAEIMTLLLKTKEAYTRLAKKREQEGKQLPTWGKEDFSGKLSTIKKEIEINEKILRAEIAKLCDCFNKPAQDNVTLH